MLGSSPAGVAKWMTKNHYKKLRSKNLIGNKKEGELITRRESNESALLKWDGGRSHKWLLVE